MPTSFTTTDIETLLQVWNDAGLDPGPLDPIIGEAHTTLRRLSTEHRTLTDTRERARHEIVAKLADGDLDLLGAVQAETAAAAGGPDQRTRISSMYRTATDHVCMTAYRQLQKIGDLLITEHLAPAHDELVAAATKAAPLVVGIDTDATAVQTGGKALAAWSDLNGCAHRRDLLRKALSVLSSARIVEPLNEVHHSDFRLYRNPETVPPGLNRLHPALRLVALLDAGTGPSIYTAAQALENYRAWDRADRGRQRGGGDAA